MADRTREYATEARWRAIVARLEGRSGIAGAWGSAAEAWLQGKVALADSLECEAGRMQFAAEVRRHIALAQSSLKKEREQIGKDIVAGLVLDDKTLAIEETWKHVAEWAEDDPAATDAWADVQVFAEEGLMYAETRWRMQYPSSDFSEILTNWISAAKARIDARVRLEKARDHLKQQRHRSWCWAQASVMWRRANEARTIGNIEEAAALEHIAGSLEHAATSPAVEELWFVLHQGIKARDAGRAEVAMAWERAAHAWREGNEKLAETWEGIAFDLEQALTEEKVSRAS